MRRGSDLGSVLSGEDIRKLLEQGKIFRPGTWDPDCIRSSAYDLRMAEDLMVVPDPDTPSGRRVNRGEKRTKEVILRPGDVAFFSTLEKLCMPWDLSGIMGAKFSLTARGILTLTGIFVDPGAGLTLNSNNVWVPMDDQRLHFFFANVGPDLVVFAPGKQRIAAIQFTRVAEPQKKTQIYSAGFEVIDRDFFDHTKQEAGLVFFRNMADIRLEVQDCIQQINRYEQQIDQFNQRLSGLESGSNQILMFGVYLLSATILGASIAIIFSLISNIKIQVDWPHIIIFCTALFVLGWIVRSFLKYLQPTLRMHQPQGLVDPKKGKNKQTP